MTMKLKLEQDIVTRYQVEKLAEQHPDVTEIDWNGHEAYSASAIDQILRSFPDAAHTGMSEYTKHEFGWVMRMIGLDDPDQWWYDDDGSED